ncbi:NUDIX domain-containing protein [Paenibacillus sp. MMS18-CY102]|uniref:NUDIX domain-containing protein n=1 Tax=Paenibacillus sp. MMS18-CY102 TaxID=2682849 RepID=UPI001365236D|nr:NUDIX domain-containing protein [Paenibacillus sp. MMS18-CY102]MWC28008.1 NUDIX domain-containing protein [Paenibacillus sp. MMS18-CY102]
MSINYCVTCGSPMATRMLDGVERRVCTSEACGAVHWGNYSIGVGALVIRDGKILLVRRAQEPGKGNWTNPGGYIEQLEDIGTTVVREVLEETGVTSRVKSIIALRDQPRSIHNVYIGFEMEYVGGEPTPDGVEVDAAAFFALDELEHMPVASFTQWLIDVAIHKQGAGLQEDIWVAGAAQGNQYYRL